MSSKIKIKAHSYFRGHLIVWDESITPPLCEGEPPGKKGGWVYADTGEPLSGYGGNPQPRPCAHCGKQTTLGDGEVDPCLGVLPGVDNACCGHGRREESYIRFTNGVVIKGFVVE